MRDPITVRHETVNDVDFMFVSSDSSEAIRAAVLVPFNAEPIKDGHMPSQTPHVMEHVICNGDGAMPPAKYNEHILGAGGYTNAFTSNTRNLLTFETIQPDDNTDKAALIIQSAFNPSLSQAVLDKEREIVRNEMLGNQQNPGDRRIRTRLYKLGLAYEDIDVALDSLDAITTRHMQALHTDAFTRQNARIVLSGNPSAIEETMAIVRANTIDTVPSGRRFTAVNNDVIPVADYHAPAPDKPSGTTDYMYLVTSSHEELDSEGYSDLRIAMNALFNFIQYGEHGLQQQSRNRGLSYGIRTSWAGSKNQVSLSVSDTTLTNQVDPQISLFNEALHRLDTYTIADFEQYRRKQVGSAKLQPDDVCKFSKSIEEFVATDQYYKIITLHQFRASLENANPSEVVKNVKELGQRFRAADFIVRSSFGENPFSA